MMMASFSRSWLSRLWSGGAVAIEPATLRDAHVLAQLHGDSFHRGWGEGEFETMLTERNTLVHRLRLGRKIIGFAVSRMAADEAGLWGRWLRAGLGRIAFLRRRAGRRCGGLLRCRY